MSKHGPEYARQRNEKYFTPAWVTEALMEREAFFNGIFDPGAGAGHIMDVFDKAGHLTFGSDIEPDDDRVTTADFLDPQMVFKVGCENVVSNPPFGIGGRLAVRFVEQALTVTRRQGGKVAMLLPLAFDAAKGRRHIFGDCPEFAGRYVLTTRIRWANLEQKAAGPMENHQWCIWDHRRNRNSDPFTRYI